MSWKAPKTHSGGGNDLNAQFACNLAYQEARAWADYLKRGTRQALMTWRDARAQLRRLQERVA